MKVNTMSENNTPAAARKVTKLVVKGTIAPSAIKLDGKDKNGQPMAQITLTDISNFKAGSKTTRTIMAFGGKNGGNLKLIQPVLDRIISSGNAEQVELYVEAREGYGSLTFISLHTAQARKAA